MKPLLSFSIFLYLSWFSVPLVSSKNKTSKSCDDGKSLIQNDFEDVRNVANFSISSEQRFQISFYDDDLQPEIVCMEQNISYPTDQIPNRGKHRPIGAELGEYSYLPPSRYITNLLNGTVVFLYHPSVPENLKEHLRLFAHQCVKDYIITSFRGQSLNETFPLAVVLYRRVFLMSSLQNHTKLLSWITSNQGKLLPPSGSNNFTYTHFSYNFGKLPAVNMTSQKNSSSRYCQLDKNKLLMPSMSKLNMTKKPESKLPKRSTRFWVFVTVLVSLIALILFALLPMEIYRLRKNKQSSKVVQWNDQAQNSAFNIAALIRRPLLASAGESRLGRMFAVRKNPVTSRYTLISGGSTLSSTEDDDEDSNNLC